MFYTEKIQKAIEFAVKVHQLDQNQKRKGKLVPYIIHPLSVAIILGRVGAPEDVIIAGILHDTIEDSVQEKKVTREDLEKEFGKQVADIVNDLSEQDKSLSWDQRKKLALEHIPAMDQTRLLVKTADLLHNMTDLINDYLKQGDKIFLRFNASKEKQLERYQNLMGLLEKTWSQNPLLPEMKQAIAFMKANWT